MKLLAGFLAAALAQDSDRWGYYDYYGNGGRSQVSQTGIGGQLAASGQRGTLGNGRICWHCNERSYGACLSASASLGDAARHGAAYCTGEDYFCFASERRVIRNDINDYNFEKGQPWSSGTATLYQEDNGSATANQASNTAIRVEMGCQQPSACLRQMNQNYKIEIGLPYHMDAASLPFLTLPAVHGGLAREGSCRVGTAWADYATGNHQQDNWRNSNWNGHNSDRRYGAVENHYNFGKGTESYCHYCCDPLIEFGGDHTDTNPATPYDYAGCNYNKFVSSATQNTFDPLSLQATGTTLDGAAGSSVAGNQFIERSQDWDNEVWNDVQQYHGMFRNPHSQYPRKINSNNNLNATPNGRRRR